jgi:hypothetical protein
MSVRAYRKIVLCGRRPEVASLAVGKPASVLRRLVVRQCVQGGCQPGVPVYLMP